MRVGYKNPSLRITICHYSASLVMPNGNPRDGYFYPTLSLMIHSYSLYIDSEQLSVQKADALLHLCVLILIWIKCEVGTIKHVLSPTVYFYWPLQGDASFVDPFCYLRFVFVFGVLSCLFLTAEWSHAGKGLTSRLSCVWCFFVCVFVTFPYGVPGQVWYLIVSILNICLLLYFHVFLRP